MNRLRHFYIARELFLIVCVTFLKRARFSGLFTSLLVSQRGAFNRLRHFYKASDVFFLLFTTLLYSKGGVFYWGSGEWEWGVGSGHSEVRSAVWRLGSGWEVGSRELGVESDELGWGLGTGYRGLGTSWTLELN